MATAYQLFIDGQWRDAADGEAMPAINPYDQSVHTTVPVATAGDVEEAIRAARRALTGRGGAARRANAPAC